MFGSTAFLCFYEMDSITSVNSLSSLCPECGNADE